MNRKQQGFTIIEVVLVLAIAGLIFLMVFIALPALQKGQRDTQRRNDLSQFAAQVNQYQSNNKGVVPTGTGGAASCNAATAGTVANFVSKYLTGANEFNDPSSGSKYTCATAIPTATGSYYYLAGNICDGESPTTTGASNRNFAVVTKLEGSGSACRDNQ